MKTRNTISVAILSVLVCFVLLPRARAAPRSKQTRLHHKALRAIHRRSPQFNASTQRGGYNHHRFHSRQAGETFPKLQTYENPNSIISQHPRVLRCVDNRIESTSSRPATGWRLSGVQHSGRAERPLWPHHGHREHSSWLVFAL